MADSDVPGFDLIKRWLSGEGAAAADLHGLYLDRILRLVRRNVARRFDGKFDAEDVAQSVFRSLFRGIGEKRFAPESEEQVWGLLRHIALWKVRNRVEHYQAAKRNVDLEDSASAIFRQLSTPSAEEAVEFYDLIGSTVKTLRPPERRTMELMIEGRSTSEIAMELQVTTKSVQRYQKRIRERLKQVIQELQ